MLKKERQIKYFNKIMKSISANIRAFEDSGDLKIMHDLRVEIKKVRALLKFTTKFSGIEIIPEDIQKLKRIFKHAGLIREARIYLQMAENEGIQIPDLKAKNEGIIEVETKIFKESVANYSNYIDDLFIPLTVYFNDISSSKIPSYFKSRIEKLDGLFSKKNQENNLHNERKRIKHLLYVYEILPGSLVKKINMNKAYLEELQNLIGKWHDRIDVISILKNLNSNGIEISRQKIFSEKLLCDVRLKAKDFSKKAYS